MKVLTYNIRGLGGRAKRKVIKKLIAKEGVELLCIQEKVSCENTSSCAYKATSIIFFYEGYINNINWVMRGIDEIMDITK